MVNVSIEDTGAGIEPSNLNWIFSPLFTTKSSRVGPGHLDQLFLPLGHLHPSVGLRIFGNGYPQSSVGPRIVVDDH